MKTLEESILELVNAPGYRPVKPRVIAEQLKLPKDDAVLVRRMVKQLVRHGKIRYASNHLVLPANTPTASADMAPKASSKTPRSSRGPTARGTGDQGQLEQLPAKTARKSAGGKGGNRVVGVFQRTQKGFGFVRLDQAGGKEKAKDIYIPAEESADAATGDVVLVEIGRQRGRELGPRGRIVEVVERQTHQFVGTYFESAGAAYVRIDGAMFARPISVGDPGAKNARADDKVVVEMLRFPSPLHDGEGVIAEVLGPRGKPGVDTLSIIREFNLPDRFAEDAIEEADRQADAFDEAIGGRKDFTGETIVTIDPVDARDFDDAISLERLDGGHWRLGVHIADVSHFVRPKTALDREAIERATSVYLPDRVLPMLPEVISNGLASLQPGKVRYTKSAVMEFTEEGLRVSTELYSAAIRSSKRLTYEQVDEFLTDREASRRKLGGKVCDLLGPDAHVGDDDAQTPAGQRRARIDHARGQGGPRQATAASAGPTWSRTPKATRSSRSSCWRPTKRWPRRSAIAGCTSSAASTSRPARRSSRRSSEFVAELGYKTGSLQSRFELQKLLDAATGRPEQHAVHFAVLRSLQRAIYSPMEEGHYALASECYCHFTSPIRRYPDLTIHRLVDAMLTKSKPRNDYDELVVLGAALFRPRAAGRGRRTRPDQAQAAGLSEHPHRRRDGRSGDRRGELRHCSCRASQLPAEGLVRVETLRDDHYCFDRASHTLAGHRAGNSYRLGDLLARRRRPRRSRTP